MPDHVDDPVDTDSLRAALDDLRRAPDDEGTLEMIVSRPAIGERQMLDEADLDRSLGLLGDSWSQRPSRHTDDGGPNPDMQLMVMSARFVDLIARRDRARWELAGDQLYVDLDLSIVALPAGSRLSIGTAIIEVTDRPHTGCAKFAQRYGVAAQRFVNSDVGRALRLRGLCARVVRTGQVQTGDTVRKLHQLTLPTAT